MNSLSNLKLLQMISGCFQHLEGWAIYNTNAGIFNYAIFPKVIHEQFFHDMLGK